MYKRQLYAYDENLNFLWKFQNGKNTGHFPYTQDFNGDGRDEIFCGYNMISADGELIWTLPVQADHTDEIAAGKFRKGSGRGYLALASGTDGFIISDLQGNIVFREGIGHAQRISIGNYTPERREFGICLVNYWGHQGIIYMYDTNGNTPVSYTHLDVYKRQLPCWCARWPRKSVLSSCISEPFSASIQE